MSIRDQQNGASDSLFPKENLWEASDARFLPTPRYQTEQCLDPIPSTQPTEVFTGEIIINVPDTSLSTSVLFSHIYNSNQEQANSPNSERDFHNCIQAHWDGQFEKENLSETSDARLLREPSYQNAKSLETTQRTEPPEVCGDNISQFNFLSLAIGGTSEESHATGEKTMNIVPGRSLEDAAKSTRGKTTGSAGSKRDWAWKYCSPIEGNSMAARETTEERNSTEEIIINVPGTSLKGAAKSTTVFQSFLQQIQDILFEKENPSETSDGRLLPEPSYPNAKCLETTPRTEPAEVRGDNISQGDFLSLAVGGTSEERHATGEKTINTVPGSSLKDAAKSTRGKTTGIPWNKRDWAWKYCSTIEGNSNGVICSFCGLEIKGGGITRFKSHLSNSDPSKNVKKCEKVPSDVKVETEKRIKRA